jgi:hypothetical protein
MHTLIPRPYRILEEETPILDFIETVFSQAADFPAEELADLRAHRAAVALANELLAAHTTSHPLDFHPANCAAQLKAWHLAQLAAWIEEVTPKEG